MSKTGKLERYRLGVVPIPNPSGSDTYWEDKASVLYPPPKSLQKEKSTWHGECSRCGKRYRKNKSVYIDRSAKPSKVYHPQCYLDLKEEAK